MSRSLRVQFASLINFKPNILAFKSNVALVFAFFPLARVVPIFRLNTENCDLSLFNPRKT